MVKKLYLEHYRCFDKIEINLKDFVMLVGENNAGKSTIIEAMRMISYVSRKCDTTTYKDAPTELGYPVKTKGIIVPVDRLKINLNNIVSYYEPYVAKAIATFENGCKIEIRANDNCVYGFVFDSKNNLVKTNNKAKMCNIEKISVLPQIGPLRKKEEFLTEETVKNDLETYRSSLHFRNEIYLSDTIIKKKFKKMAESNWPNLIIDNIKQNQSILNMLVREGSFTCEIGLMGNGLQMWLQIIWFICKSEQSGMIVLDEPDVYMHPDLQLKLLEIVKILNKQVIISTHSIEMISTMEAENILILENRMGNRRMYYANHSSAVQNVIDSLGGIQNISIIRLGISRCCLFVEGEEDKILPKIYHALFPDDENILSSLPTVRLGGFSKVYEAFGTAKLFHDEPNSNIRCICILDSDYHSQKVIDDLMIKAKENHLKLHIWQKKEIENYLIIPDVLYSFFDSDSFDKNEFLYKLDEIAESMKQELVWKISDEYGSQNRGKTSSACHDYAERFVEKRWNSLNDKLSLLSGKEYLKRFREWARETYKIDISNHKIIMKINNSNVDSEMIEVMEMFRRT